MFKASTLKSMPPADSENSSSPFEPGLLLEGLIYLYLSIYPSIYLSIYLYINVSIYIYTYKYIFIHMFMHMFIHIGVENSSSPLRPERGVNLRN